MVEESSSFVLAPDSSQAPNSMPTRGEENNKLVLEAQEAIRNDSTAEEGNDDQLMQGLGQITAPIEMQNQIEQ